MSYDTEQKARMLKRLDHDFRNHKATRRDLECALGSFLVPWIAWREPGTSNYSCNFLLFGNRLIITGDMGESIHVWSDAITPEFVARIDYAYFASKAQGLDGHVRPYSWDTDRVRYKMKEAVERWTDEGREFDLTGWDDQCSSAFEWEAFVHEHEGLVHAGAYEWGRGPHYRSLGHWYGFKKAYDQLNNTTTAQAGI